MIYSQEALAMAFETEEIRMKNADCYFSLLAKSMEQKRDEMSAYLENAGLQPITPGGGYFIVADISSIGKLLYKKQIIQLSKIFLSLFYFGAGKE